MITLPFTFPEILCFILLWIRVGGLLFFLPFFGESQIPVRIRVFLALTFSFLTFPVVNVQGFGGSMVSLDTLGLAAAVLKELFFGFTIGYIAKLMLDGVVMGASLVGYQMGFGMASLFLPDSNDQLNAFTILNRIVFLLIFLSLNLHHVLIEAIHLSLKTVRLGVGLPKMQLGEELIGVTGDLFSLAIKLASPVLIALLFTMAALGLIARVVPQLNVFVISFPLSFFVGLLVYAATVAFMPVWIVDHVDVYRDLMNNAMATFVDDTR